eukprot:195809-Hanusia_phi.AAC.1
MALMMFKMTNDTIDGFMQPREFRRSEVPNVTLRSWKRHDKFHHMLALTFLFLVLLCRSSTSLGFRERRVKICPGVDRWLTCMPGGGGGGGEGWRTRIVQDIDEEGELCERNATPVAPFLPPRSRVPPSSLLPPPFVPSPPSSSLS